MFPPFQVTTTEMIPETFGDRSIGPENLHPIFHVEENESRKALYSGTRKDEAKRRCFLAFRRFAFLRMVTGKKAAEFVTSKPGEIDSDWVSKTVYMKYTYMFIYMMNINIESFWFYDHDNFQELLL